MDSVGEDTLMNVDEAAWATSADAMTGEQIAARYRAAYPYTSDSRRLALHRGDVRYRHLLVAAQQRERLRCEADRERIRSTIFGPQARFCR
jgi:hypothetical protein